MSRPDIPVTISGDSKGFEASLARIRALTKSTALDVVGSIGRIKSLAGGVAGVVAGIVSASTVAVVRDAASAIAAVGDEARRAGLDVKSFQELKFVAEQNRVGVDALTDGIKELNLRADEFILTGSGSASEAFKRLGLSADDIKKKLKDPSALFTEIIGKLQHFDKAAQIRIMDEVFGGTGGEQFVQLIEAGEAGIRDQIKAANDLGLVLDEQLIKKAAEVDRKFNLIATTVGVKLKSAVVSAADSLAEFIDGFRDYQNQRSSTLRNRQAEIGLKVLDLENKILETKERQTAETEKLSAVAKNLGFENSKNLLAAGVTGQVDGLKTQIAELKAEEAKIVDALNDRVDRMNRTAEKTWTPPVIPSDDGKGKGKRSDAERAAEKEKKAIDEVIQSLRDELAVMGLTDIERERTIALREAGVTYASKEGQEISNLIDQKYRQLAAEEELIDSQERMRDAAQRMGDTLDDQLLRAIDGTFDLKEALAAVLTEVINVKTNGKGLFGSLFEALSGGFGGGAKGLFSSSFVPNTTLGAFLTGGARAGGGDVSPGRIYRVNEYEDEFMVPTNHGRIIAPSKLQGERGNGAADGGRSVVQIELSEDLVAKILQQASGQTVQLMKRNEAARTTLRQNGGDY
ncbi:phage tail tape measure protein [Ensifer adhaerens]|uniref:phage tail tape measure protein n=1 Tax=Ensifer adhaerens TaxID=106592 RepID=UPI0021010658|nr:phage tail tape measure protein [Ensifer adhaerens]UTV37646.1 phage tail tape measure protein [Ensifer adhaerens]